MSERTDAERLDALEAGGWTIHCNYLGPDRPDNWVVTEDNFEGDDRLSFGATVRQAIDAAMSARVLPPEDQEPAR